MKDESEGGLHWFILQALTFIFPMMCVHATHFNYLRGWGLWEFVGKREKAGGRREEPKKVFFFVLHPSSFILYLPGHNCHTVAVGQRHRRFLVDDDRFARFDGQHPG